MLAYVLCLRRISTALCEMFPTNESLIQHGLITRYMLSKLTSKLIIDNRAEMVMLEGEAKRAMCPKSSSTLTATRCLGRVWHAPLSWANVMIRRSISQFHNFTLKTILHFYNFTLSLSHFHFHNITFAFTFTLSLLHCTTFTFTFTLSHFHTFTYRPSLKHFHFYTFTLSCSHFRF